MDAVERLKDAFMKLNSDNLDLLDAVYSENMSFEDPLHKINGLNNFKNYCANLYQNVESCTFCFNEVSRFANGACLQWEMLLKHPRLNGGKQFSVVGATIIYYDDKIYFHRDYFDLGAMLYEKLPLIGGVIRVIKRKLSSS